MIISSKENLELLQLKEKNIKISLQVFRCFILSFFTDGYNYVLQDIPKRFLPIMIFAKVL